MLVCGHCANRRRGLESCASYDPTHRLPAKRIDRASQHSGPPAAKVRSVPEAADTSETIQGLPELPGRADEKEGLTKCRLFTWSR